MSRNRRDYMPTPMALMRREPPRPASRVRVAVFDGVEEVDAFEVSGTPEQAIQHAAAHLAFRALHMPQWRRAFLLVAAGGMKRKVKL